MKTKTVRIILITALASVMISGCSNKAATEEKSEPVTAIEPVITVDPITPAEPKKPEEPEKAETTSGRQDGERFEETIIIEGMEETVKYEHVRDESLGIEMDYDYESFVRRRESDRECFISIYDDPQNPENYLEITYSPKNTDEVEKTIGEELSKTYDIIKESYTLESAGNCRRIDASVSKGGGGTPDNPQTVYVIPSADGSIIATAHYSFEAAEGFGRRFAYMMNTLVPTGERKEGKITEEQALSAIRKYCRANNPDLEGMEESEDYTLYWDASTNDKGEIVVLYRSYTGAQTRYYIDQNTGETYVTELVPGIIDEEQRTDESFNIKEYLD